MPDAHSGRDDRPNRGIHIDAYLDVDGDGGFVFTAQCAVWGAGDCGWKVDLTEPPWKGGLEADEWDTLTEMHKRAHRG
jgi:hypothetical protein